MRSYYLEINEYLQKLVKSILMYDKEGIILEGDTLSIIELLVLKFLGDEGEKKMYEIIEGLSIDRNSLVTIVNNLQQRKYITKIKSLEDKRVQILDLTDKGKKAFKDITYKEKDILFSLLNDFSFNEEKAVLKFLVKLDMLGKEKTINCLKFHGESNGRS